MSARGREAGEFVSVPNMVRQSLRWNIGPLSMPAHPGLSLKLRPVRERCNGLGFSTANRLHGNRPLAKQPADSGKTL